MQQRSKAQASIEYMSILAIGLLVILFAVAIAAIEPQISYSSKVSAAKNYWVSARPISINDYEVGASAALLEIKNNQPISITLRKIAINGVWLPFAKAIPPFNESAISMCDSAQQCSMHLASGESAVILITNMTSHPSLAAICSPDGMFQQGRPYEVNISFGYKTEMEAEATQSGRFPIVGSCMPLKINETQVVVPGPLQILTDSLPDGRTYELYMEEIFASGCLKSCEWKIHNLPWVPSFQNSTSICLDGMTSHMLTGYPTIERTTTVVISATDYAGRTATKKLNLTIQSSTQ
ncbi:MAG: hypothetical protein N3G80_02570 [Candidatus Micrarchaeota archaeon]|nr:hypothetical protein [Candidatus Micrarchaeota archaeon]